MTQYLLTLIKGSLSYLREMVVLHPLQRVTHPLD